MRSCQRARSSSSLSEEKSDFFERQPQSLEGAAHGGVRDPNPVDLFDELTVFVEGQVGVEPNLLGEESVERCALAGGRSGDRLGFHISTLAAQLQVALYGRQRNAEGLCNFFSGHPTIDCRKYSQPEIS
jgi:hypothetical protein